MIRRLLIGTKADLDEGGFQWRRQSERGACRGGWQRSRTRSCRSDGGSQAAGIDCWRWAVGGGEKEVVFVGDVSKK